MGAFHSHGGTPMAGWWGKIPIENRWELGVALWLRKAPSDRIPRWNIFCVVDLLMIMESCGKKVMEHPRYAESLSMRANLEEGVLPSGHAKEVRIISWFIVTQCHYNGKSVAECTLHVWDTSWRMKTQQKRPKCRKNCLLVGLQWRARSLLIESDLHDDDGCEIWPSQITILSYQLVGTV